MIPFCSLVIHIVLISQEKEEKLKQEAEKKRLAKEKKDHLRVVTEKKALQLQLKQNIVAAKNKPGVYSFDLLNTDDETEDESNPKPGRPSPPEWSLRKFDVLQQLM